MRVAGAVLSETYGEQVERAAADVAAHRFTVALHARRRVDGVSKQAIMRHLQPNHCSNTRACHHPTHVDEMPEYKVSWIACVYKPLKNQLACF